MSTIEPILPGNFYHLYNHSNGNQLLFREGRNYVFFLDKFIKYLNPYIETYAYCLMSNHFHFLVKVKEEFEVDGKINQTEARLVTNAIKNWLISYTQSYHKVFGTKGNLYYQKIRRKIINDEEYLMNLIVYINLNPVLHGFVDFPYQWNYSSYKATISNQPTKIRRDEVIDLFGGLNNFKYYHDLKVLEKFLEKIDVEF